MSRGFCKLILQLTVFVIGALGLLSSSVTHAGTYRFDYTSDLYGNLGYFTVDESLFESNIGFPGQGYLVNQYITDLSFAHKGYVWGLNDVPKKDYTIFILSNGTSLPEVQGGSGALATIFNPDYQSIVLYGEGLMNIADSFLITGEWTTSYISAVPEPNGYSMIAVGLVLCIIGSRKNAALDNPFG